MFVQKGSLVVLLSMLQQCIATNPIEGPIVGEVTKYQNTVPGKPSLTVVHADVVAPSGSTAVIDFASSTVKKSPTSSTKAVTSTSACPSISCPMTLIPHRFPASISTWIENVQTTFSVPPGSTPVIHFSPIQYGENDPTASASRNGEQETDATTSSSASPTKPPNTPSPSGTPETETNKPASGVPHSSQKAATGSEHQTKPGNAGSASKSPAQTSGGHKPSGTPQSGDNDAPESSNTHRPTDGSRPSGAHHTEDSKPSDSHHTDSSKPSSAHHTDDSKPSGAPKSTDGSKPSGAHHTDGSKPSSAPKSTDGLKPSGAHHTDNSKPSGAPKSTDGSKSSDAPKSDEAPNSSQTAHSQTPSVSDSHASTPSPDASASQQSSVSHSASMTPGDSPDATQMSSMVATLTGSSSAEVAAMISHRPTDTATVGWDDLDSELSKVPTGTTTGTAVATEGIELSGWLTKLNGNVQDADLKDPETWNHVKNNLEKTTDHIDDYVENRKKGDESGSGSSDGTDTGCTSGGGLFGIFKAVSCFVKKGEDAIKGGSESIGPIINGGLNIAKSGFTQLKDDLPKADDITDVEVEEFKQNFEDLTEGAETLEELEKEEEKKSSSSSSSSTSTTTSSETCTSTKTVKDCTSSTLFITSTITGSEGSASPTVITRTTSTCSTQTGCDVKATTAETTSYTHITNTKSCFTPFLKTGSLAYTPTETPTPDVTTTIDSAKSTTTTHSKTNPSATNDSTKVTTTTHSKTIPSTTMHTTTKPTTSACEVKSFQITSGYETICACSTTSGKDTVTSTITTPSGGKCGDYKAFPTTGFMNIATDYAEVCGYHFEGHEGSKDGHCACSTSSHGSSFSQYVPLPYTQGSQTALECDAITSVSFTPTSKTSKTSVHPSLVTDYTSTDLGDGVKWAFATASVTFHSHNYGGVPDFLPFPETNGVGTATYEEIDDYVSTDGLKTYYYAKATGDGDGDVTAVGTPTSTAGAEPTQNCVRYVIPGPDTNHVINSAEDEFIYVFWGIDNWDFSGKDLQVEVEKSWDECEVTEQTHISLDTDRWGTMAMWNNGRDDTLKCMGKKLENLGSPNLKNGKKCEWILQTDISKGFWYEDTMEEEMEWINKEHGKKVHKPYPLTGKN